MRKRFLSLLCPLLFGVSALQAEHTTVTIAAENNPDGITFVGIPEFQSLGTVVGQNVAGMVTGRSSLEQTGKSNQAQAERTMKEAGYLK